MGSAFSASPRRRPTFVRVGAREDARSDCADIADVDEGHLSVTGGDEEALVFDDVAAIRVLEVLREEARPQQSPPGSLRDQVELDLPVRHPLHPIGARDPEEHDVLDPGGVGRVDERDQRLLHVSDGRRPQQDV